jgi:hypothetical protein
LWGRVLAKFQETRAITYVDDGYIKTKLSIALQVLAEFKTVFKSDAGLELNVSKTSILPKDFTAQSAFDIARTIMETTPTLTHLTNEVLFDSFYPEGFIGSVPIGTDAFVRSFVSKTCRDIIDDVEKLDVIQDGFIHYQFLRFCQVTRLQYINSHIMLPNRCVLQQQHVDCKIPDALLKKGTKHHTDGWDTSNHFILSHHALWHPFQTDYTVRLQGGLCVVSITGYELSVTG